MGNQFNCCHADQDENNYTLEPGEKLGDDNAFYGDSFTILKSGRRDFAEVLPPDNRNSGQMQSDSMDYTNTFKSPSMPDGEQLSQNKGSAVQYINDVLQKVQVEENLL